MGNFDEFDIHHRDYELVTLEGRASDRLATLCRKCHKRIEYCNTGEKRTCLVQKEKEFERLKSLHQLIILEGMSLKVTSHNKKSMSLYNINYTGNRSFLEFYTLEKLVNTFTFDMYLKYRKQLRLPLPFKPEKYRQAAGASLIDIASNKKVINVHCTDDSALIKVSIEYLAAAEECLMRAVSEGFWKYENK